MIPFLIAALVVGAGTAMASSGGSSSRNSNRREVQYDYDKSKKEDIQNDIEKYKENSIQKIKNNYNTDIEFVKNNPSSFDETNDWFGESTVSLAHSIKKDKVKIVNKNKIIKNEIKKLKNEVNEISILIEELETAKNETIR